MVQNKKILALDIGDRRIGVAIASEAAKIASPLETIDTVKTDRYIDRIVKLVQENDVSVLVIGLPRGLDGQDTLQTEHVRKQAKEIAGKVEIPVAMQDEAGTSVEAEERLKSYGKPYTKADIDSVAASIILYDYLREAYVS